MHLLSIRYTSIKSSLQRVRWPTLQASQLHCVQTFKNFLSDQSRFAPRARKSHRSPKSPTGPAASSACPPSMQNLAGLGRSSGLTRQHASGCQERALAESAPSCSGRRPVAQCKASMITTCWAQTSQRRRGCQVSFGSSGPVYLLCQCLASSILVSSWDSA